MQSIISGYYHPRSSLEETTKLEFFGRSVIRKTELQSILNEFIKENC